MVPPMAVVNVRRIGYSGRAPRNAYTLQGVGTAFAGRSRVDAQGAFFTTKWIMLLGPVIPIGRYYVRETGSSNLPGHSVTRYEILGQARLDPLALVRTLLFCWICAPGLVVGPSVLLLSHADDLVYGANWSIWLLIATFIVLLIAGITATTLLIINWQRRWAPLHQVRWVD